MLPFGRRVAPAATCLLLSRARIDFCWLRSLQIPGVAVGSGRSPREDVMVTLVVEKKNSKVPRIDDPAQRAQNHNNGVPVARTLESALTISRA